MAPLSELSAGDMRVPVTVLTGFLGSGKSSFINAVLKSHADIRFGVVVNEFGDIPLESEIVQAQSGDIVELSNGCMCCVARNDLLSAVQTLRRAKQGVDHILIEASGLSDPVPVAQTFLQGGGRRDFQLGSILCMVDATRFGELEVQYRVIPSQLEFADYVIVNRYDSLDQEAKYDLERRLQTYAARARVLYAGTAEAAEGDLAIVGLQETHERSTDMLQRTGGYPHHQEAVSVCEVSSERPLDVGLFGELLRSLPPGIVRGKGIVYFAGRRYRRYRFVLQHTAGRTTFDARRKDRNESCRSYLLFIGKGFDTDELRRRIAVCILSD